MDPVSIFAAVPKIALFFLLIVGGAIAVEIFYFGKKRQPKTPEVSLPPTPEPLVETIPPPPAGGPPTKVTEVTSQPSPPPKKRLSRKTLTALSIVFFLAASIPAAIILVQQRQEIRERAGGCPPDSCTGNGYLCAGDCACNWQLNKGVRWHYKCVNGKVESYNILDSSCDDACPGEPTPPPGPTSPPEGCSNQGQPCDTPGYPRECCGSLVCDYNTCKPCSAFTDEARCWTHNKCYWVNGSCQIRPAETPPPDGGNITCSGSVKNNTNQPLTCRVSYFSCAVPKSSRAECEADPFCGGSSSSKNFTLQPGQSSESFLPGPGNIRCGVWQYDYTVDCGGGYSCSGSGNDCNWDETCEATPPPTPTPTPTPPPEHTARCEFCKVYDEGWNEITDLSTLTVGQTIYFATRGVTSHPEGITKARFRINGGMWQETTDEHGTNEFYIQFTIPAAGSYTVESMVYNPTLGWW